MITLSIFVAAVSGFVYGAAQHSVTQNATGIARLTVQNSGLGDIEEGQTVAYSKAELSNLGSAPLIVSLFGAILIITLSVKLEGVDHEKANHDYTIKEITELKQEIEKLKGEKTEIEMPKTISPEEAEIEEKKRLLKEAYRSKLILYPIEVLNLEINKKIESGKTRKQAIDELFEEEIAKHE